MKLILMRALAIVLVVGSLAMPAHAYIDPGTGALILQAVIGGIAAAGAVLSIYWQKVKAFFGKIFKQSDKENK